jgi:hypothetical protein
VLLDLASLQLRAVVAILAGTALMICVLAAASPIWPTFWQHLVKGMPVWPRMTAEGHDLPIDPGL